MNKFSQKTLIFSILLLAGLILVVSGCLKKPPVNTNQPINQNQNQNTSTTTTTSEIDTSDWQTYRNKEYGFEFKYPLDWTVNNLSDGRITLRPSNKELDYEYIGDIIVSKSEIPISTLLETSDSVYKPIKKNINKFDVYFSKGVPAMVSFDSYIFRISNLTIELIVFNNQDLLAEAIIETIKL